MGNSTLPHLSTDEATACFFQEHSTAAYFPCICISFSRSCPLRFVGKGGGTGLLYNCQLHMQVSCLHQRLQEMHIQPLPHPSHLKEGWTMNKVFIFLHNWITLDWYNLETIGNLIFWVSSAHHRGTNCNRWLIQTSICHPNS